MSEIKNGDKVLVRDKESDAWQTGFFYIGKSAIESTYPYIVQDMADADLIEYKYIRLAPSEEEVALEEIRSLMRKHGLKEVKL